MMAQATLDEVLRLAEQLSQQDQQALIAHLQAVSQQRKLSFQEWKTLYDSLKMHTPVLKDFSNRREDWYEDDGR
jgi:hypothetical protein